MTAAPDPKSALRDAASVVAVRRDGPEPRVLMGQRGKGAVFMPSKFVFPGGALDTEDAAVAAAFPPPETLARRLGHARGGHDPALGAALAIAGIRELWEETGLALSAGGEPDDRPLPGRWTEFVARHGAPDATAFELIFRAITPPGRPRRFDARFLMVEAERIATDPDDFSEADQELAHLSWLTLAEARRLDLPFVTELVIAEVEMRLGLDSAASAARPAPFLHHDGGRSYIEPL